MRVFVSHSEADLGTATLLASSLNSYDVNAVLGRPGEPQLQAVVSTCDACVVLLGAAGVDAKIVREAQAALRFGLEVVPMHLEQARVSRLEDLPPALAGLSHPGFPLSRASWDDDVRYLVRGLRDLIDPSALAGGAAVAGSGEDEEYAEHREQPAARYAAEGYAAAEAADTAPAPELVVTTLLDRAVRRGAFPRPIEVRAGSAPARPPPSPAQWLPQDAHAYRLATSRRSLRRMAAEIAAAAGLIVVIYELARRVLGLFDISPEAKGAPNRDLVDCTVFAPMSASPGSSCLIQVFAHLAEQTDDARALATEFDPGTRRRGFQTLRDAVPRGARLTFELRLRGAEIESPVRSLIWRGSAASVGFDVALPHDLKARRMVGTVLITRDGGPLGEISFTLAVEQSVPTNLPEPVGDSARRYSLAFISYASGDRNEVLKRVPMLTAAQVKYFEDLIDLEPGDQWWPRLKDAIDRCDLFLLFWSSEAKTSPWVRREVAHALARQAGDDLRPPQIRPVILEGPPPVAPWEELAHLHFNDPTRYFLAAR